MFTVHFIIVTDISYQTQSKKPTRSTLNYRSAQLKQTFKYVLVLSRYMIFIWVFFLASMGLRGNIGFLLVIVDPCNSQGVIITGNRALPVIKFTLFLESSKQLNLLAQKTTQSVRHFQPL